MKSKLAILGGDKVIKNPLKKFNRIGTEEIHAVNDVLKSGNLSSFIGDWEPDFFGGRKVLEFEEAWSNYFNVKHSITVNSWTSGLICAVGALDIEPGDEVIIPTWTMAASASCVLVWNAIPVFTDIDQRTFNIDPKKIEEKITSRTKAILSVDIFGLPADMDAIMSIAKKHNLKVISDTAQAPGALYKNKKAGTISHIGGFSLNYHKHIHTGEGGVIVTDDDDLAFRMKLIRNHADAVAGGKKMEKINNLIGFNFRLGEIECAIGIEQLKKLDSIIASRVHAANRLTEGIKDLEGLTSPFIPNGSTHVYYNYPLLVDEKKLGISAKNICLALSAEGFSCGNSYINVHKYPTYQKKIAYGMGGYPWKIGSKISNVNYNENQHKVAESYSRGEGYIGADFCNYEFDDSEIDLYIRCIQKVWDNLSELKNL